MFNSENLKDPKNHIIASLKAIDFSQKFIDLCNKYPDFENGKNIKKSEILELLKSWNIDFKVAGAENCFFKDYQFGELKLRFLVDYKHGFIDPKYNFWTDNFDVQILGGFKNYSELVDPLFNQKVQYRFPISTNLEEARIALSAVIELHCDFLMEFQTKIEN